MDKGIAKADDLSDQVCPQNFDAGPGGCIYPPPDLCGWVTTLYRLFELSARHVVTVGMDGVRTDVTQAESIARGLGLPWNERTITGYQELLDGYVEKVTAQMKAK